MVSIFSFKFLEVLQFFVSGVKDDSNSNFFFVFRFDNFSVLQLNDLLLLLWAWFGSDDEDEDGSDDVDDEIDDESFVECDNSLAACTWWLSSFNLFVELCSMRGCRRPKLSKNLRIMLFDFFILMIWVNFKLILNYK